MDLDDIEPVLNPALAMNLRHALLYTRPRLRIVVALAFAEISMNELIRRSGLPRTSVMDYIQWRIRIPLGAAVRLARVFGVPAVELFENGM